MELSEGFRAGIEQFVKDADLDEEFRAPFTAIVEQSAKEAAQAIGQLGLEKSASEEETPALGRYLLKVAADGGGGGAEGAGQTIADMLSDEQTDMMRNRVLLGALLGTAGGGTLGGLVGHALPYLLGAQRSQGWTGHIPVAGGALAGALGGMAAGGLGGGISGARQLDAETLGRFLTGIGETASAAASGAAAREGRAARQGYAEGGE